MRPERELEPTRSTGSRADGPYCRASLLDALVRARAGEAGETYTAQARRPVTFAAMTLSVRCRRGRGSVALACERHHGGVVDEAVDDGGGDHGVAEDLAPSLEARLLVTMIEPRS